MYIEFPFLHILTKMLCSFWCQSFWQVWDISLWFWFAFFWWLVITLSNFCAKLVFFFFFNNKAVKSIFLFEKVLQRIYYNLLLIRWEAECDKNSLLLKHSPRMLLPIFPSHPISVTLVLKEFKCFSGIIEMVFYFCAEKPRI